LDWEGARSLAARGFEIGSHTLNHPILSRESHAEQVHELSESRQMLEDQLSTDVTVVAYPNGMTTDYDLQTLAATREAGYRAGVTCRFGWNDARSPRFEMRRVLIEPTTGRKGLVQALVNPVRAWSAHRVRRFSQTLRRSLVPGPRHAGQGRD
jgi:peptidoglycan/xylan/chitin deacetylase (PgdA/CDA1 family)